MSAAAWGLLALVLALAAIAWRALDDWRDRRRVPPPVALEPRAYDQLAHRRRTERAKQLGIQPLNWD